MKNVPGRPKTDRLDAVRLAKLAERGMVRASSSHRSRCDSCGTSPAPAPCSSGNVPGTSTRVGKALQDVQIKLSGVVSDLFVMSGRAMLDAMVAGERNPRTLADLAESKLDKKKPALIEALTGQFEDHGPAAEGAAVHRRSPHRADRRTRPADRPDVGGDHHPARQHKHRGRGRRAHARTLPEKLDAVPGIGLATARILLAEIGADTSRFPTLERLVSWAKLCPRTIRSVQREEHLGAGRAGYPLAKGRSR